MKLGANIVQNVAEDLLAEATAGVMESISPTQITARQKPKRKVSFRAAWRMTRRGVLSLLNVDIISDNAIESAAKRYPKISALSGFFKKAVNNPWARFCFTAGLILASAMALGFSPAIGCMAVGVSYTIKAASNYAFFAIKKILQRTVFRKKRAAKVPDKKEKNNGSFAKRCLRSFCKAAFGAGQKNPYMNALDVVMTFASGILLLPISVHLQSWLGGVFSARLGGAVSAKAALNSTSSAATRIVEEAGMQRAAQASGGHLARNIVQRAAEQEAGMASGGVLRRVLTLLGALPERAGGIAAQSTVKALGGNLAKKYGPQLGEEIAQESGQIIGAAAMQSVLPVTSGMAGRMAQTQEMEIDLAILPWREIVKFQLATQRGGR